MRCPRCNKLVEPQEVKDNAGWFVCPLCAATLKSGSIIKCKCYSSCIKCPHPCPDEGETAKSMRQRRYGPQKDAVIMSDGTRIDSDGVVWVNDIGGWKTEY